MASNFDKELAAPDVEEAVRKQSFEERQQDDRRNKRLKRAQRLSTAAMLAARFSGNEELGELFQGGAEASGETRRGEEGEGAGAVRQAGANFGGKMAGQIAGDGIKVPFSKKKLTDGAGLSRGSSAAIGGAVAGALDGEGVVGIAKSAVSWWVLDLVFGSLFMVLTFVPALLYLDFHFIMNKLGSKLFGSMTLWQKMLLAVANLIALILPMIVVAFVYAATCGNGLISTASSVVHYASLGYVQDYCAQTGYPPSGGAGATGDFSTVVPIPEQYVSVANFGDAICDYPLVKPALLTEVTALFTAAAGQNLNIKVTSALRNGNCPAPHHYAYSCHYLGEAVDISLIPGVTNPLNPSAADAARINELLQDAANAGFGFTQDEYRHPSPGETGPHVHMGLTGDPNCNGRQSEAAQFADYYKMPY